MSILNVHISAHRTICFIRYYGVFVLLFLAPYQTFAQNNLVASNTTTTTACPSGYHCYSGSENVTVEFSYNGNICPGQYAKDCYNESDPRGFVAGPRQRPVVIQQEDRLIAKTSEKYDFSIKLFSVSRSNFDSCNFTGASAVVPALTKLPFEVPTKFIAASGIKYFIAESKNMVMQCQYGLKLEVNVRSRAPCINPSGPANEVCSSKGLCATLQKFFTANTSCVCNTGYIGSYCEERDSCHKALNPCRNGATCIDRKSGLENEYNCTCLPGYDGKNCESNIDDCKSDPCQNGAICLDKLNHYQCLCSPGYFGENCEKLVADKCDLKPCQNGGTCKRSGENRLNYTCICPIAFAGRNCTENVTIPSSVAYTTSVIASIGKSSVVSDVMTQTSTLDTIHLSTQARLISLQTVSHSLTESDGISTSISQALSSGVSLHSTNTGTQLTPSSESLSESSTFTLDPSLSIKPAISMSNQSTFTATQTSSIIPSVPTSEVRETSLEVLPSITPLPSISITPSSLTTELPVSSSEVIHANYLSNSSMSTTPMLSTVQGTPSSFEYVTSSIFSATATPLLTSIYASSAMAQTSLTTPPVLISTHVLPTTAFSVFPTTTPTSPTIIPLKEQTCKNKPCNNGTCLDLGVPDQYGLNFTCHCPKPTYGPRCSTDFNFHFPRFSNGSYLVHKPIAFADGFNKIVITFKTSAANGLLFYSKHRKFRDFMQLYITGGKLEYRFEPGDYLNIIQSNVIVNTGKIVTAVITYDNSKKEGSLQVDNNAKQTTTSLGSLKGIGLYSDWFIGGLPPGKSIDVSGGAETTSTFIGCIKDIELNGDQIGFTEATDWNNLNECDTPCNNTHKPCHNNGQCIPDPDDPHDYECNCTTGFLGKNCKKLAICNGDPCKGGLCVEDKSTENSSKVCLCPFGRGGRVCEEELKITIPKYTMAYGYSSFIQYQVPTLSGPYFAITLQFKIDTNSTALTNALLMFSGQNEYQGKGDDFIALGINNSKVLFQYNLGSGIANIQSDPIDLTREWHSLTAGRNGKEGYLYLDNQTVKRGSSAGQLSGLNLYSPLYIGGVPDLSELPMDVLFKNGFQGAIANGAVRFGMKQPFISLLTSQQSNNANEWPVKQGRNIGEDSYNGCNTSKPCQNNGTCTQKGAVIVCSCVDGWKGMYCASREIPCVNQNPCADKSTCREVNNKAVCDCPLGKTGDTCSSAISIQRPRFKENSYMAFTATSLNIRSITRITIKFTPYNENGLLFYVANKISTQKGDFLSITLHNGFVQYRYNLGSGVDSKQSKKNVSLNNEHTVTITRDKQDGTLKVDDEAIISVKSPGKAVALDVHSNFYLGGVPQLSLVNPSAVEDVKSLKDFVGCVSSVMVNDNTLSLTETGAVEGRNIDNCPLSPNSNLA